MKSFSTLLIRCRDQATKNRVARGCTYGVIPPRTQLRKQPPVTSRKIRWYMKMNLREALHLCELRNIPQGHPGYRFIGQEMWRKIQEVHPTLAEVGRFIDWKAYRLGRLQSEMRTEFKKSVMQKEQ